MGHPRYCESISQLQIDGDEQPTRLRDSNSTWRGVHEDTVTPQSMHGGFTACPYGAEIKLLNGALLPQAGGSEGCSLPPWRAASSPRAPVRPPAPNISGQPAFRPRPHWSTTKTSPTRAFFVVGHTFFTFSTNSDGEDVPEIESHDLVHSACHRQCHVRPTVLGKPRLYLVPIGEPGARGRHPAVLQCIRRGRRCHVSRSLDIKITVRTLREREPSALLCAR